jgi:hypothetical protein
MAAAARHSATPVHTRSDPFFSRFFLAGAVVGVLAHAWFSPPAFTPTGIIAWAGFTLLAALNFAGYAASLIFLGVAIPNAFQVFRLFGVSAFHNAFRTALLFRRVRVADGVGWQIRATLLLLPTLFLIGWYMKFQYVAGIASFVFVHLGIAALFVRPPAVLFLPASNSRTLGIIGRLRLQCGFLLRIVALLDRRLGATVDDREDGYFDNFRTRDDDNWRATFLALKDMTPVIIIDTDAATEGVLYEIGSTVRSSTIDKVLFLAGTNGSCQALEIACSRGLVTRDMFIRTTSEVGLVPAIWHAIHEQGRLPRQSAPETRVTTIGELLEQRCETDDADRSDRKERALASLKSLIETQLQSESMADAEPYLRQGLETALAIDPESETTIWYLMNLAAVLSQDTNVWSNRDAEAFLSQALALQERLNPRSPVMAVLCSNYAMILHGRGDTNTALHYMERAHRIAELELGSDHELTSNFQARLKLLLSASRKRRVIYMNIIGGSAVMLVIGIFLSRRSVVVSLILVVGLLGFAWASQRLLKHSREQQGAPKGVESAPRTPSGVGLVDAPEDRGALFQA